MKRSAIKVVKGIARNVDAEKLLMESLKCEESRVVFGFSQSTI